jgi:Winged helix DNA-binding domain
VTREDNVLRRRLRNQALVESRFRESTHVVAWLGAVQAQDYAGAKWGVGQRVEGLTDGDVERAFNEGAILRTHVLRPTWHFVMPADIRWMLALTGPRVHRAVAYYYRKLGLDAEVLTRSRKTLERVLGGRKELTRAELASALERAGIRAERVRLAFLMMDAELEGVICSGARRGKQFTYALLEERAPHAHRLERDEALGELVGRYFSSQGPATVRDLVWWSGLTVREAKRGIEIASALVKEVVGDLTYWSSPTTPPTPRISSTAHLLPNYDEYLIAYKDRALVVGNSPRGRVDMERADVFPHYLVNSGRLAGTWKPTLQPGSALVEVALYAHVTAAEARAITNAAERYGSFVNVPVTMSLTSP